jgi:hypothetical protein
MYDALGVRTRREAMPGCLELSAQGEVVVDLAVQDYSHGAVFVTDGLPSSFHVNDAEAPMGKPGSSVDVKPAVVRPAMFQGIVEAVQVRQGRRTPVAVMK